MQVAVLALQGGFAEHEQMLRGLGVSVVELRQASDLGRPFQGLILPGGESTVQGKLLRDLGLLAPLRDRIADGLPVFGTCAGLLLLLLAREISGEPHRHFATMDTCAIRNAYGRQLGSFSVQASFAGLGTIRMPFIRAPYIDSVRGDAHILVTVDGRIVAARQGNQLVTAFHPELTDDPSVHRLFLSMIQAAA